MTTFEEKKEKMLNSIEGKKTFEARFKFEDVLVEIEAKDEEEANDLAQQMIDDGEVEDSSIYEFEVEELKNE